MKGISKVLLGLGAAAVMVLASMPVAEAQCANARNLGAGSGNNDNERVRMISTFSTLGSGNELGSIWEVGGAGSVNSGGDHFGATGTCTASGNWIKTGGMFPGAGKIAINASLASPTCLLTNCPAAGAAVITVVEDAADDGSTAGFIAYTVDDTPAGFRWYDHARAVSEVTGIGITEIPMEEFPTVGVTNSAGDPAQLPTNPLDTTLTANYVDLSINVRSAFGAGDTPGAASQSVLSYDIMQASGTADPGRDRSAYALLQSVPYADAAVTGDSVPVPCADLDSDTWLAVGVTFADGIPSRLVGTATAVECDPQIANPDGKNEGLRDRKIRRHRSRSVGRGR